MNETLTIANLDFEIRRSSKRRTLGLTVDRAGDLVVHAPAPTSDDELRRWINKKLLWVHQKLAQKRELVGDVHPPQFASGESIFYLGHSYRLKVVKDQDEPLRFNGEWFLLRSRDHSAAAEHFQQWFVVTGGAWLRKRAAKWNSRGDRAPTKIVIGDLGFRWGSCGKHGVLYFNWRLLQLPVHLIDYVIAHEHMHLIEHNHSPAFWAALERRLPDWRVRKTELEEQWSRYARFALAADGSRHHD